MVSLVASSSPGVIEGGTGVALQPFRIGSACEADPLSATDHGVGGVEGVPFDAVCDGCCLPSDIFGMGDGFKMVGVATGPIATKMVDFHTAGDWPLGPFPHDPVGVEHHALASVTRLDAEDAVPLTVGSTGPEPAVSGLVEPAFSPGDCVGDSLVEGSPVVCTHRDTIPNGGARW